VQHEDFNGFLLWSCYVLEPQLGRVVEEALDFATSTGLCEVQGILPDLPGAVAGELERVCYVTA
jgi:pantoate kinase